MIELRRNKPFSREYVAKENGTVVAELSRAIWRRRAEMNCQGHTLRLKRQGAAKSTYALRDGDATIAEVEKPSVLRSRLAFRYGGNDFEIVDKAWYSQKLLVKSGGSVVGSIRRRGVFASGALVDLPDDLPLALRVFVGWIGMVRWDDEASAAVAGAAVACG